LLLGSQQQQPLLMVLRAVGVEQSLMRGGVGYENCRGACFKTSGQEQQQAKHLPHVQQQQRRQQPTQPLSSSSRVG
jgi:hypothetical protein